MTVLPAVRGVIDRRLLVNYRVDAQVMAEALPDRFFPKVVDGYAVGGICLIRLRDLRPRWLPPAFGTASENAAHRIAVEWNDSGYIDEGVYIPRRDTDSRLNTLLGGRLFPGVHHHATFDVAESGDRYEVAMTSDDGETEVRVAGDIAGSLPDDSVFDSVADASRFFERGSLGYSPNGDGYEGLALHTDEWDVTPMSVDSVTSSYFETFPDDAVAFDHALLMEDVDHEWRERQSLCSAPAES